MRDNDSKYHRELCRLNQVTVNRKRKLEQMTQSEGPTIQDFMQKIRAKRGLMTSTACVAPSITNPPLLPPNTPVDVLRFIPERVFFSRYFALFVSCVLSLSDFYDETFNCVTN